ncbi:hypothetical protein [Burkholderia gladioli]|uniref:hypothetical protein n=1 Tax=Burkholderia gladioli TaxID=28095 RepID=UPI00163F850A|nr:hypothetical protein [Burkholderia gladioli]
MQYRSGSSSRSPHRAIRASRYPILHLSLIRRSSGRHAGGEAHWAISHDRPPGKTNRHVGSDFDAFLAEDAMLETATAIAMQRAVAWRIKQARRLGVPARTARANAPRTS